MQEGVVSLIDDDDEMILNSNINELDTIDYKKKAQLLVEAFHCNLDKALQTIVMCKGQMNQAADILFNDQETFKTNSNQKSSSSSNNQIYDNEVEMVEPVKPMHQIFFAKPSMSKTGIWSEPYDLEYETENIISEDTLILNHLPLKEDHRFRPIWVLPNCKLILEAKSRFYREANDFLVAIAEPTSRPANMHEYTLTRHSLFAAVSLGLSPKDIVDVLEKLSKLQVPEQVKSFIQDSSLNFGKAKLVLKSGKYFIESPDKSVLETLLEDNIIKDSIMGNHAEFQKDAAAVEDTRDIIHLREIVISKNEDDDLDDELYLLEKEQSSSLQQPSQTETPTVPITPPSYVYSLEVEGSKHVDVRRASQGCGFPLIEEYDFRKDVTTHNLFAELKPDTKIRPYQERCLSKMFGNGRARSGIIVLPCGAGKTLAGIAASCTLKKSCIILCTGAIAAEQWRRQYEQYTKVNKNDVYVLTSKTRDPLPKDNRAFVLISTYTMLAQSRQKKSRATKERLEIIRTKEWGLMILDEVHVTPAKLFRQVLTNIKAQCKLGLTATLVREDDLIDHLNFLIGPKLYEANWLDLTNTGFLARVSCKEVRCAMTKEFYHEYLSMLDSKHRRSNKVKNLLYTLNPNKILIAKFLMDQHEAKGDKVLVFCDSIMGVKQLAERLNRPYLTGSSSEKERSVQFTRFCKSTTLNTLILSKIGDIAIDLPEANVILQVSSHFGSRRQEAQRLGRILRPSADRRTDEPFDSYFYTLISVGTIEDRFSAKRKNYLVDQGYAYEVMSGMEKVASQDPLYENLLDKTAHITLLHKILDVTPEELDESSSEESESEHEGSSDSSNESEEAEVTVAAKVHAISRTSKRRRVDTSVISGAANLTYLEYDGGSSQKSTENLDAFHDAIEPPSPTRSGAHDMITDDDVQEVAHVPLLNSTIHHDSSKSVSLVEDEADHEVDQEVEEVLHLSHEDAESLADEEDDNEMYYESDDERLSKLPIQRQILVKTFQCYLRLGGCDSSWKSFQASAETFIEQASVKCVYETGGMIKIDTKQLEELMMDFLESSASS